MPYEQAHALTSRRLLIALAGLAACAWLLWYSARIGYAHTLAKVAALTNIQAVAERSVELSPYDAETRFTRGELLVESQTYDEAVSELANSTRLRPRDYYLWLELGIARDQAGDQEGALRALRQATSLAPAYAKPRWQLGNLLLRMGQYDDAFAELRKASSSNPGLFPSVVDLAWGISQKDVPSTEATVVPHSDFEHMTLAGFFAKHGAFQAAINEFSLVKNKNPDESQSLLNVLLDARAFNEAYAVWATTHQFAINPTTGLGRILNGGFEDRLLLGDPGFGWQITPNLTNISMSLDETGFQGGAKSLRIEFRGDSEPQAAFVSQLVLVAPEKHYRLTFYARARQIISAALPVVIVEDASNQTAAVLGQSGAISAVYSDWRALSIEFTTTSKTTAVNVRCQRQACADRPCPAFGTLWLDSFELQSKG